MLAAMHGKIDCVEKLLEAGANVCYISLHVYFNFMNFFIFYYFIKTNNYEKLSGFNV